MKKNKLLAMASIFLIFIAIIFSNQFPGHFIPGEYLFRKLGLPTASHGTQGFQYAGITAAVLAVAGSYGVRKYGRHIHEECGQMVFWSVIGFILLLRCMD